MFLRSLSQRITRPVMPDDEAFEYLPTQAIADFLATDKQPPIDGIVFPSVQAAGDVLNVVLFHKVARVAAIELPDETDIEARTGQMYEEGWETEYTVIERLPRPTPPAEEDEDSAWPGLVAPYDSKGQRVAPRDLSGQQYAWTPERSPTGQMTIVVSKSDGRVVVLRNGVEIGRSVAEVNDDDPGSHVITLTSGKDGTPRWVYVGLPGHEEEAGKALDEAIINRLRLPRAFYQAVRGALRPGTTILITQSPVGTSAGEPLTVMDAVVPQP